MNHTKPSQSTNKIPKYLTAFEELPKFLRENNIKLFSSEEFRKQDIINYFLEKNNNDEAFNIIDLGEVLEQYKRWKTNLPRITPYYAVKSCPDPMIMKTLDILGCNFDCASKNEIISVTDLNIGPDRIIYANPVKDPNYLKFARSQAVNMMTFDSEDELYKIKLYHPYAQLILRIKTDDSHSVCRFSSKFGIDLDQADSLLDMAKSLNLNIVGVSFHVGSQCSDANSYISALKDAKVIFDKAAKRNMKLNIVDIGGGFPGSNANQGVSFEQMAAAINEGFDLYFNDIPDLKVMAEPGRYFSSASHTLVFSVIGKKKQVVDDEVSFQYYMNDGVYGSFNCIQFDNATPMIVPFYPHKGKTYKTTFFGPTCDSIDTICKNIEVSELCIGEWCYVENFGAYTHASASTFNGFEPAVRHYILMY